MGCGIMFPRDYMLDFEGEMTFGKDDEQNISISFWRAMLRNQSIETTTGPNI